MHATTTRWSSILFVDDDPLARSTFRRVIGAYGFEIDVAGSGFEALTMAQRKRYPLVVTDLRMPGMDGISLVQEIQQTQPRTAFLLVTGMPELDLQRAYPAELGISGYVTKPWTPPQLLEAIQGAFDSAYGGRKTDSPSAEFGSTVLLVEDHHADADVIEAHLHNGSAKETDAPRFDLKRVERLSDALEVLKTETFAAVIVDLGLPDSDGTVTIEKIREVAPLVPTIVITGFDDETTALRAMRCGAQDYLVKGHIDGHSLRRSIRYAVERKRTELWLRHLADDDALTGLVNRATFVRRVEQTYQRVEKQDGQFAIMLLGVDRFESINEEYGHDVGDHVLIEVGNRLRAAVRDYDTVARIGGDVFAVLAEDVPGDVPVNVLAQTILESLRVPFAASDQSINVTGSLGLALYPEAGDGSDALIAAAHTALRRGKETRRNAVYTFSPAHRHASESSIRLENAVCRAAREGEFTLFYQPQVDFQQGRVVGLEALMRWFPEGAKPVPPLQFIPLLEQTGLIEEVGAWVLDEACRRLRTWHRQGLDDLRIAVNVSPKQFEGNGLVDIVANTLARHALRPEHLEVEITESVLMQDTQITNDTLSALKELGVRIAIDDFGTGYSSLSYLHRFSVDCLKIDRSFVDAIGSYGKGDVIANAIVGMGRKLGLDIVAEGIETEHQARHLWNEGCNLAQGYFFARPKPEWSRESLDEIVLPQTTGPASSLEHNPRTSGVHPR